MKTKVARVNGVWTMFGNNQPVATFPTRELAREGARKLHQANSVEEFMKDAFNMTDEQIAQRIQH